MVEQTFRRRLTFSVASLCLATLAVVAGGIYLGARAALLANVDSALLAIARAELASALDGPGGKVHVHDEDPTPLTLAVGSGYEKFAIIFDRDGGRVAQTHNLRPGASLAIDRALLARAGRGAVFFADVERAGDRCRAIYYPLNDTQGRRLVTVCAIPRHPVDRALQMLGVVVLGAFLVCGSGAVWASQRLARRLTYPLERIAAQAHAIGEASLADRLPAVSRDAELVGVTDALNAMLARLEGAFDTQRRFVLDASHELRSPLTNLRGTIEVALRRPRAPEEYRETLTVALAETERLSRLAADLLLLSRTEMDRWAAEGVGCDLAVLARQSVCAHEGIARERGVGLYLKASPTPVRGDPHRLRQAVDNLLDNALRYAPAGTEVAITVGWSGAWATLSVGDKGPGIAPEHLPHLFERFYRADTSRARHLGGVGLGLAIVRAIVTAYGGRVEVKSAPGQGALFTLTLPVSPDHCV